ncbi:heme exporter protein CcmD [Pseudooceanicola sp. CBS1P-1]|uniref:Heme exporter protein D n=1 Tax=Pseudooceanicola albus TaxID=2692189 RepID=A0A6L7FYJ7_9RHOB|nr:MULTISPECIES: heme exporter protein CcmD [Pseudooceanicola]MBT9382272.1 heme exporter protein CcmD [Pseudooceanicola endophyticus]MXN16815.1 heme exporter protein CcmD [Pseudooceanicola albus]
MPDLGKYAGSVLSAYAVSLLLLAVVIVVSVMRARRVKRRMEEVEARAKHAR